LIPLNFTFNLHIGFLGHLGYLHQTILKSLKIINSALFGDQDVLMRRITVTRPRCNHRRDVSLLIVYKAYYIALYYYIFTGGISGDR